MSKGNLFLGFGRGAVGDVVFSHYAGEQIARARNRSPKNPKTPLQLLQRVIMKTASSAYSLLRPICDHSFQGYATGTPNQSRFLSLNVDRLRLQIATLLENPQIEDILTSDEVNFSPRVSPGPLYNAYQVSEGVLAPLSFAWDSSSGNWLISQSGTFAAASELQLTYQNVLDFLGLQKGDQLTFLFCYVNDGSAPSDVAGVFTDISVSRIILEPSNGDMTEKFFVGSGPVINKPNVRNEGNASLLFVPTEGGDLSGFSFSVNGFIPSDDRGTNHALGAAAVIVSRQSGGVWQRSTSSLVLRPYTGTGTANLRFDHGEWQLGNAVESFMGSSQSSLYLNQAQV